jgi:membrane protease YdiL (CAAX protease family)
MQTTTTTPTTDAAPDTRRQSRDPLWLFAAIALPTGWIALTVPFVLGLPTEPFVLVTLVLGLVLPALVLTRRDPRASLRNLVADVVRMPRPRWLLLPALLLIPGVSWLVALPLGAAKPLSIGLVQAAAVAFASSFVIVNLWEEMAWAGFFQRRAMTRWGYLTGSLVTAGLFAAVHLPLAVGTARSVGDVVRGLVPLVAAGIGMRLLIGAFDTWTGRSIFALAMLHATFNVTPQFLDGHDVVRYGVTLGLGLIAAVVLVRRGTIGGER